MTTLFSSPLHAINVGVASFAEPIVNAGATVTQIDWAPPAQGDRAVGRDLARLIGDASVEAANQRAFDAYCAAQPVLEGVGLACELIPLMGERTLLHSGPPIAWERMCGPMQGAIIGAIVYEGWAADVKRARTLADRNEINLAPCHHHDAVGPMSGIISPSMPVWAVRNATAGNRAFCNMNEGLGKVLRFGANSAEVIARLKWLQTTLAPVLQAGLRRSGAIEVKPLIAQALHMGDEVHNRNAAASSLLLKRMVSPLLTCGAATADITAVVEFIAGNDHFFLNVCMAACKAMLDAARNVEASSMVTAMCRNGVDFGLRVSGTGDAWFTAPAPVVDGLYFAGYSKADAAADLGDSSITETAGLGGFAMAAAPAIVKFVGGAPADAVANTLAMTHITLGRNSAFTLPALNFGGTPAGIDVRKVVDSGIAPVINTGIAHSEAGVGQIGAGVTQAPMGCFSAAISELARTLHE